MCLEDESHFIMSFKLSRRTKANVINCFRDNFIYFANIKTICPPLKLFCLQFWNSSLLEMCQWSQPLQAEHGLVCQSLGLDTVQSLAHSSPSPRDGHQLSNHGCLTSAMPLLSVLLFLVSANTSLIWAIITSCLDF